MARSHEILPRFYYQARRVNIYVQQARATYIINKNSRHFRSIPKQWFFKHTDSSLQHFLVVAQYDLTVEPKNGFTVQ